MVVVTILIGVICVAIAWAQWYAVHVNVPKYEALHAARHR